MPHPPRPVAQAAPATSLIVFDFDGTVCLGDDPALAYAHAIDRIPGISGAAEALRSFIENPRGDTRFALCDDPYDVVNIATADAGITPEQRNAAYLESRADVAGMPVHTPEGLRELLDELDSELVLLTNAPSIGFEGLLDALGLTGAFHRVITDGGKPRGMHDFVAPLRAAGRPVLSIGDKWVNDLEPVAALGGQTALIDSYELGLGHPADHTAPTLVALYPHIREWDARHSARRTA